MGRFTLQFLYYKANLLFLILMVGIWGSLWIGDQSPEQLIQVRQMYQENLKSWDMWQTYQTALRDSSSVLHLLKRYRKIPNWTRSKVRDVLLRLIKTFDLSLRDYQIMDAPSYPEGFRELLGEAGEILQLRVAVGSRLDAKIFDFVQHLNTHLSPWIKVNSVLIQRCGSVEEPLRKEGGDMTEYPDILLETQDTKDLIEARIELAWLVTSSQSS